MIYGDSDRALASEYLINHHNSVLSETFHNSMPEKRRSKQLLNKNCAGAICRNFFINVAMGPTCIHFT